MPRKTGTKWKMPCVPWDMWSEAIPMEVITGAETYSPCDDLWVITTYFNPCHYRTRLVNYQIFAQRLERSGISMLTVECAFGTDDFELSPAPNLLQVRGPHVLWQKERLLNVAVAKLPPHVEKVAWVDGDVLFSNPDWAVQTSHLLEDFPVLQLFEHGLELAPGATSYCGEGPSRKAFAYNWIQDSNLLHRNRFRYHGQTGLAWAARRKLLGKHGLYDAALAGNGDRLIAHAMCGDFDSPCIQMSTSFGVGGHLRQHLLVKMLLNLLRPITPVAWRRWLAPWYILRRTNSRFKQHFIAWGKAFYRDVQGRLSYVPGAALHLWHGDMVNRQYSVNRVQLHRYGFDPVTDLRIGPSGCWEWKTNKPELRRWAEEFFYLRREDG